MAAPHRSLARQKKASVAAWEVLQAFMQALPTLSPKVKTKTVHLWTESYGGHYGPTFFRYFHEMNEGIKNGSTTTGIPLELGTLGIGSGIIDALAQFPKFPEFAANNTYNISLVPGEVARYMDFACRMSNGCIDQVQQCREAYLHDKQNNIWHRMGRNKMIAFLLIDQSPSTIARCAEATYMCRDNVEGPYYFYGSRNMYDIRRPADDTIVPQQPFVDFLNLPATRAALGIDVIPELCTVAAPTPSSFAYAAQNEAVYNAFTRAGDYVFPSFLANLEYLLEKGIRVLLMHGEADYIANWFGGEAVSLALSYPQSFLFQATPYTPLAFDDPENPDSLGNGNGSVQGKVREYGNLSFAVVHNAGHFLPFDKPALALEMFRRAMANLDLPTGRGPINSTAVPFVPDSPLSAAKATARGVSSSASSLLTPSQCI